MNWIEWIYSFFGKSNVEKIPSESKECEGNSAIQQSVQAESIREMSPKNIRIILDKIRQYDILEDTDFEYIQKNYR